MANHRIKDSHITSSSQLSTSAAAVHARLNSARAWSPASGDTTPWLQIDFVEQVTLNEIQIQGSPADDNWVKNFTVFFSDNGIYFQNYSWDGAITVRKLCSIWFAFICMVSNDRENMHCNVMFTVT